MHRDFYLREVSYPEFREACIKVRGKAERHATEMRGGRVVVKRYCLVEKPLEYTDLGELLDNADDTFQESRCVWSPDSDMSVSEAKRKTLDNREEHYAHILRTCQGSQSLLLDISRNPFDGRVSDTFEFGRQGLLWVVRYFNIHPSNFRIYRFNGVNQEIKRSNTFAVVGVYRP